MTPQEKEQEKARLAQARKEFQEAHDRKYGWVKRAKRQNYYDTDRVFRIWLKERLDEIFDADSWNSLQELRKGVHPTTRIGEQRQSKLH